MKIDNLIDKGKENFRKEDQEEVKKERCEAIKETLLYQMKNCNLYRQLCKEDNFNPHKDLKSIEDIAKIPYLTTGNFKRKSGKPKEFLCVPEDQIQVWTNSSGTSGDPSVIGRDLLNITRFFKMFHFVLDELCSLPDYNYTLFFQPKPAKRLTTEDEVKKSQNHMGYIFNVANKLAMEKRVYTLKFAPPEAQKKGKIFEFDPDTTFGFLNSNISEKGVGWIGGSIPLMYGTLMGYYKKTGQTFNLDERSVLVSGGGWKSFSGESVDPEDFRNNMSKVLGIPKNHVLDVYSFTETDCVFAECEHHNKHCLPWQDVIVRDVETLEPVEQGEKGLINVINPIAHGFAGISVLQDDIVKISIEDTCPCGRKGKVIEVMGRAEGAEARGCGAQIEDETA